eukprot:s3589_g3.t3
MLHLPLADRSPNAGRIHRMQIRSVPLKDQLLHRMPSQVRLAHMMDDHIHQMRIQSDPGRRTAATIRPAPNHGPTAYTVRMRIPRDRSSEAMIATMRAANHASKRTWESEVCEWETAVAKYGPDVEYVPSSWGFKHCELDQSQHRFKARIVALGDSVRDYGRLVEKGQLHGRPITLEGSRALDCYAGLQPDDDCQAADAESSTQSLHIAALCEPARLASKPLEYLLQETASMGPSPLTVALWGSCCGRVRCVRPATLLGP